MILYTSESAQRIWAFLKHRFGSTCFIFYTSTSELYLFIFSDLHHFLFIGISTALDLIIAFDTSDNIDMKLFTKFKALLKEIIKQYKISRDSVHISIVSFGRYAVSSSLLYGSTYDNVLESSQLLKIGGVSDYAVMLENIRAAVVDDFRRDAQHQLIIFAVGTGKPYFAGEIKKKAIKLKNESVSIFVVDFMTGVSNVTLNSLIDSNDNVFVPGGITEIPTVINAIDAASRTVAGMSVKRIKQWMLYRNHLKTLHIRRQYQWLCIFYLIKDCFV